MNSLLLVPRTSISLAVSIRLGQGLGNVSLSIGVHGKVVFTEELFSAAVFTSCFSGKQPQK